MKNTINSISDMWVGVGDSAKFLDKKHKYVGLTRFQKFMMKRFLKQPSFIIGYSFALHEAFKNQNFTTV